ncbi:type VI secretion IcmF C-terminal domain-containing protein [Apirhabdus apintestini]|nr:type VI secretion IcmF C-terminal domain-containing protein [Enterobacteriaceae bacterium CA-0114]
MNYAHGPIAPVSLTWPGARQGSRITLNAMPRIAAGSSALFTGPWALFRWLDSTRKIVVPDSGETELIYSLDKRRVDIEATGLTVNGALASDLLRDFRCPGAY